jgi:hypothetical protein
VPKVRPVVPAVHVCDSGLRRQVEQRFFAVDGRWEVFSPERCEYLGDGGRVTIRFGRSREVLDARSEFAALKKAFPGARVRDLNGAGVAGIVLDLDDSGTQVFAVAGEHEYLMVSVLGFGEPARVSGVAEGLARGALKGIR